MTHSNMVYLTADHRLVSRVRDIGSESDLRFHLNIHHNASTRGKSKRQMAMAHLLAHTVMKSPGIKEKLGIPQEWGGP